MFTLSFFYYGDFFFFFYPGTLPLNQCFCSRLTQRTSFALVLQPWFCSPAASTITGNTRSHGLGRNTLVSFGKSLWFGYEMSRTQTGCSMHSEKSQHRSLKLLKYLKHELFLLPAAFTIERLVLCSSVKMSSKTAHPRHL